MEHYLLYNIETGATIQIGQGPADTVALYKSNLPPGVGIMQIPSQAVLPLGGIDIDIIKASYGAGINADADKAAFAFGFNNTPRQVATYREKEAEARAVLADPDTPTLFLTIEADEMGITVQDLAQEVVAQADLWRPIGAKIEALRRKANARLAAATNVAEIAAAAQINWHAVVAPDSVEPAEGENL